MIERTFKETRHKLILEKGIMYNRDIIIVPLLNLRKDILKSVPDDVHCDTSVTQTSLKLNAWLPIYTKLVDYIERCPKWAELKKKIKQIKIYRRSREKKN